MDWWCSHYSLVSAQYKLSLAMSTTLHVVTEMSHFPFAVLWKLTPLQWSHSTWCSLFIPALPSGAILNLIMLLRVLWILNLAIFMVFANSLCWVSVHIAFSYPQSRLRVWGEHPGLAERRKPRVWTSAISSSVSCKSQFRPGVYERVGFFFWYIYS